MGVGVRQLCFALQLQAELTVWSEEDKPKPEIKNLACHYPETLQIKGI